MKTQLDCALYQSFVSPVLCLALQTAGLMGQTPYMWEVVNGNATLNTYSFDRDDYYAEGDAAIHHVNIKNGAAPQLLPAYQVKDVEKIVPGNYLLQRGERGYELMLEDIYKIPAQYDERMPDVFAKAFLEGLKLRVLTTLHANACLSFH